MRAFLINPDGQHILEANVVPTQEELNRLVAGRAVRHTFVEQFLADHDIYVDKDALVRGRTSWLFRGITIWGPMIVLGEGQMDATCSLEDVQKLTGFLRYR